MKAIGIDFGTGNSVLAEWQGTKAVLFDQIGDNGAVCSDIVVEDSDKILADPALVYGKLTQNRKIEAAIKRRLLEAIEKGDGKIVEYLMSCAANRLKYVFDAFSLQSEEKVVKAVLTCPANTGQAYRNVLMEIGRQIGLPAVDIVDEPTAAAVHHGLNEVAKKNERWMVVDWGCGTFDVSLIQREKGKSDLRVVCVRGDNRLGGFDMDRLLGKNLAERFKFPVDDLDYYEVESLKKALSDKLDLDVPLTLKSGKNIQIAYTRKELEELVQPLRNRAQALIDEALKSVGWGDLDRIIATGGPILMPCVSAMLCDATGYDEGEILCKDPLTSVALGAARLAEMKRRGGLVVTNKVAKSIGVCIKEGKNDDVYHIIISRGEDRPVRRDVKLATSVDLQDIIQIEIREGDNMASAAANSLLAKLNAVVRPENKAAVQLRLQIALGDAGGMEAYVEPVGDANMVREVQAVGVRIEKDQRETATGELRTEDPLAEFKDQVLDREVDPDTARQVYERLKIKYHPDRQPEKRDYWNARLAALDEAFNRYLEEVERRMRASSVPDLPWDKTAELAKIVVDEVLAQRFVHCLANDIGTAEQKRSMPGLLKRFPDYRRVLASYLSAVKKNPVLQKLLSEDDRPHVGMVVLLQNLPGKPIRERHEVLKAAYRVSVDKVRELIADPKLDLDALYHEVPKVAEAAVNPMTGKVVGQSVNAKLDLKFEYKDGNTHISGNTFSVKEQIKQVAQTAGSRAKWDGKNKLWVIEGKKITEKDFQ